jgi:hypothetical protein
MSRSGYSEECEYLEIYRANVERAIKGKRGQAFLKEMAKALDEMPEKKLIKNDLITESGMVCAIGAVFKARGLDLEGVDPDDPESVAQAVGISRSLAAEIEYVNDDRYLCSGRDETLEERWTRMREWIQEHLCA